MGLIPSTIKVMLVEFILSLEHSLKHFELCCLTFSIQENFSIKLSYLHIFFHRNFHPTNPYTKRCAVKFPIDWCMGLSTEKFNTKSSDHPKIGFWDLASGDAKSPKIILLWMRDPRQNGSLARLNAAAQPQQAAA